MPAGSKSALVEAAVILRRAAHSLRRRHPSDGIFQNAYTHAECCEFKQKAARIDAVADDLESRASAQRS